MLLREVLERTGKAGIGRVVIRTREYLAAVIPRDRALQMMVLRFPQELVDADEYRIPEGSSGKWKITGREVEMAGQLIDSMTRDWDPSEYRDDFRERLQGVIQKRIRASQVVQPDAEEDERPPEGAATNVIDFADLLKRSLEKKDGGTRRPAVKKAAAKKSTRGGAAKKAVGKRAGKSTRKAG